MTDLSDAHPTRPRSTGAHPADTTAQSSMRAAEYSRYGAPDVLTVSTVPTPHTGPGQVRIAVRAAAVNPFDIKKRSGAFAGGADAPERPVIPGVEASGIVDEVGEGVTGVSPGDAVFGLGPATFAEYAVLDHWATVPGQWTWEQAASVSTATEAARRALDLLGVRPGHTLFIDGASGSVGAAAAQLAISGGLSVIGTASPAKHARLRGLGVEPVEYGPGLAERVLQIAGGGVDRVLDASGKGSLDALIAIAGGPESVITLANFDAPEKGVRVTSKPVAFHALGTAADLAGQGRYDVTVDSAFPLEDSAAAHARAQAGPDGKVVVMPLPG